MLHPDCGGSCLFKGPISKCFVLFCGKKNQSCTQPDKKGGKIEASRCLITAPKCCLRRGCEHMALGASSVMFTLRQIIESVHQDQCYHYPLLLGDSPWVDYSSFCTERDRFYNHPICFYFGFTV